MRVVAAAVLELFPYFNPPQRSPRSHGLSVSHPAPRLRITWTCALNLACINSQPPTYLPFPFLLLHARKSHVLGGLNAPGKRFPQPAAPISLWRAA